MDDKISDAELFEKDQDAYWLRVLSKKYLPYLNRQEKGKDGIFTTTMRGNLLGISVKGRKVRDKTYDLRYDVRNKIRTALIDLQIFIETANEKDLNEVLNRETLQDVILLLLNPPRRRNASRAKLAQLFAELGLNYFVQNSKYLTRLQRETMENATDASKQLTILEIPKEERGDILWSSSEGL